MKTHSSQVDLKTNKVMHNYKGKEAKLEKIRDNMNTAATTV